MMRVLKIKNMSNKYRGMRYPNIISNKTNIFLTHTRRGQVLSREHNPIGDGDPNFNPNME